MPSIPQEDAVDAAGSAQAAPGAARGVQRGKATQVAPRKATTALATVKVPQEQHPRRIEVLIQKGSPQAKLGMDVKHIQGKLEVVHIFPDGAVAQSNEASRSLSPPRETLQVGDFIVGVNGVDTSDHQMVAECRLRSDLRLLVLRGPQPL